MKEPINKIPATPEEYIITPEPQHRYQLTITDIETGEIMYLNQGHAGVMCFMEKVKTFGADVEGVHQHLAWGNPILQMYCFDQLEKWFKKESWPGLIDELERRGFIKASGNLKDIFKDKPI